MLVAKNIMDELGIKGVKLNINSIGCPVCRPSYNKRLREYLRGNLNKLCRTCNERFHTNPLRILDCKEEQCQAIVADAPKMIDNLCEECEEHFDDLKKILKTFRLEYTINPLIVRGLDYYTKTVFEFIATGIGAQGTVCGGGRYDGLVEQIGGPSMPGMGFGMGMERLLMVLESQGIKIPKPSLYDVFICTLGENTREKAFEILFSLREKGIKSDVDHLKRSLKAQLKYANKCGANKVIIIGEDELKSGVIKLRDMNASEEIEIKIDEIIGTLTD